MKDKANAWIRNGMSYIILLSVFITGAGLFDIGFRIYWYYAFYLLFVVYGLVAFHKLDIWISSIYVLIVAYSILTYQFGLSLVIKQLTNVGLSFVVFYFLIVHERYDLVGICRKYITIAKIILVLGFVQVALVALGLVNVFTFVFPHLTQFSVTIRLQSITNEPSYIGLTFVPVVFLSLHNLFYRKYQLIGRNWSILFVIGYMMTLSSVAYVGLILMLFILYFKNFSYRKLQFMVFALLAIFLTGYIAYSRISYIKERVDDTVYGMTQDFEQGDTYLKINYSTYALLSNFYVTRKNFQHNPLTGSGLGTHELAHEKYIPDHMKSFSLYQLNYQDANSMGLRLISETGMIGFALFLFFTIKYRIKSNSSFTDDQEILWIINAGIFVFICLSLLRNGNYTIHGKILFFFIYYYSAKQIRSLMQSSQEVTA